MGSVSRTILPVWLTTLVLVVVVGVAAGAAYLTWLPLALAGKRFDGRFVFDGDAMLWHEIDVS